MTARPDLPSPASSTLAAARLHTLRIRRGRRIRFASVATGLLVGTAVIARYSGSDVAPEELAHESFSIAVFGLLVYLVPFFLSSGAIAEEVAERTITFLMSRPAPRFSIVVGKYLASSSLALLVLIAGLLVMHVGIFGSDEGLTTSLPSTLRSAGAAAALVLMYGAICVFWGALAPDAAAIVSLLHLAVVEFACGKLPGFFRLISMNYHATQLAGLPKGGLRPDLVPDVSAWQSVVAIGVLTVLFLLGAAWAVSSTEYRYGRAL